MSQYWWRQIYITCISHNCLPSMKLPLERLLHSLHILQYFCSSQADKLMCRCVRITFCWYIQRDKYFNKMLILASSPPVLLPSYSKWLPLGNYCWRWRNHTTVQSHRNNVERTKQFNQMWEEKHTLAFWNVWIVIISQLVLSCYQNIPLMHAVWC